MRFLNDQLLTNRLKLAGLVTFGAVSVSILSALPAVFLKANLRIDPDHVWFPIPAITCALIIVYCCRWRRGGNDRIGALKMFEAAIVGTAAILFLATTNVALTGWNLIETGTVVLRGDRIAAGAYFQYCYSLTYGLAVGLAEEAATRGILQRSLVARLGPHQAQWIATAAFCGLHLFGEFHARQFAFVALLAVICGQLSIRYRSVGLPAFVHGISNVMVPLLVVGARMTPQ